MRDVRRVPEPSVPGHEDLAPDFPERPRARESGHELAREELTERTSSDALALAQVDQAARAPSPRVERPRTSAPSAAVPRRARYARTRSLRPCRRAWSVCGPAAGREP